MNRHFHKPVFFILILRQAQDTVVHSPQEEFDIDVPEEDFKTTFEENCSEENTGTLNIEYDDLHRISSYQNGGNWEEQARINYQYDVAGNLLRNSESYRGDNYEYERGHKVARIGEDRITHDDVGNITEGRGRTYQYNARNQLSQVTMQNGWSMNYGYDYTGQRLTKQINKGENETSATYYIGNYFEIRENQYIHNIFAGNKLIAVIAKGQVGDGIANVDRFQSFFSGSIINDDIDPYVFYPLAIILAIYVGYLLSLRVRGVQKVSDSLWGRGPKGVGVLLNTRGIFVLILVFLFLFTQTAQAYVFRPDVDDNWPQPTRDYIFYVHTDHLGSSNLLTEGMERTTHGGLRYTRGQVVQRIEYTPFGKERYVLNPALEELPKYTGQTNDIDTDLYYYNSRYYDPVLARFIQPDSIIPDVYLPQSLNPYSYVLNNPIRYTDPSGHFVDPRDENGNFIDGGVPKSQDELSGSGTAGDDGGWISEEDIAALFGNEPFSERFALESNEARDDGVGFFEKLKENFTLDLDRARQIANELLGKFPREHNNLGDAMRHAEWSFRMAKEINELTAYAAGIGHEIENLRDQWREGESLRFDEALMDLHNNFEGIRAARENREISIENLVVDPSKSRWPY